MRFFLFVIATALVWGCAQVRPVDKSPVVMDIVRSVPMVICRENIGSAVVYKRKGEIMAVTAAHVLNDPNLCGPISNEPEHLNYDVKIVGWNISNDTILWVSTARVILKNDVMDFAILVIDSPQEGMSFANMSSKPAEMGEEVYMVGCPMSDAATLSSGVVGHPSRDPIVGNPGNTRYIQTDAPGYFGSSGGGLFRKSDGSCIGIVVMRNPEYSSMYALKITELAARSDGLIPLSD